ncbi:1-acyl-sn-glycerol-3-phosphate acyltransferase, partial [Streptomyces californicus]
RHLLIYGEGRLPCRTDAAEAPPESFRSPGPQGTVGRPRTRRPRRPGQTAVASERANRPAASVHH